MAMDTPHFVTAAAVAGAPIKYKWNGDIAMDIADKENDRLYGAIDSVSFKAKFAVGILVTEWIVRRLEGHVDISDALLRIEAAWAGVLHPAYMQSLAFESTADDDKENVLAPLEFSMSNLGDMADDYAGGDIYLAESVLRQALLARHLMPDKKVFETWLTDTLRATAKVFPRGVDYDESTEIYDASAERPVPREFFLSGDGYDEAAATRAWDAWLKTLNPDANPYLQKPAAMTKAGIGGKPYSLA